MGDPSARAHDVERQITARTGTFTVELLTHRKSVFDQRKSISIHKSILRPLLSWATECWAYGLKPGSEVCEAAEGIITKVGGRYSVALDGDPVSGRELFWNASGGKRGTIVILGPRKTFDYETLFPKCQNVWTFDNFLAGHSPAAIRMVRSAVADRDVVACCLPRNNGIQWMDIWSSPRRALRLLDAARKLARWKPLD